MTEEKERKSFGKFKGLICITDQAHAEEYNMLQKKIRNKNYMEVNIDLKHYDKYKK